ncbi:MAG: hypothetical protein K2I81_02495 [Alphaproteobacteria bacterium]|nr:hypothetical protein [Alphaproteobacteria bacterium]
MKRYILLVCVLGLAACHSGGGHHSDYVPSPVEPAIDMPAAAQSWNGGNAESGDNFSRDVFRFTLDGAGNITAVELDGHMYAKTGENEYKYLEPGETHVLNLATLGREAGLQFADFGYAQKTELEANKTERDFYVFTGGRTDKMVNADLAKGATYVGTAVAYIEADMPGRIANQVSKTDDAKLVVDAAGNHMLSMNFSKADNPWYDVTADKTGKITLAGGGNVAADFRVDGMAVDDNYATGQFFGDAGVASEVVYRVGAEFKDNATGREVEFDSAFGGIRQ